MTKPLESRFALPDQSGGSQKARVPLAHGTSSAHAAASAAPRDVSNGNDLLLVTREEIALRVEYGSWHFVNE